MENLNADVGSSIRMGEVRVARGGQMLRTLLGSCVAVVLYDQRQQLGGVAHIVLPDSGGSSNQPGKFVDTAIPHLVEQLHQIGDGQLQLTARLIGAASMFSSAVATRIGQQNVDACEQLLRELEIPIVATHCGGNKGRRMSLHTSDGKVTVEIVGKDPIEL